MDALLELEPRDAGHLLMEPRAEFAVPADDLHDRVRCPLTICIPHSSTNACHEGPPTA
jgi:hypothetical protein